MSRTTLRPIWTPDDFRQTVQAFRAAQAPERAVVAPVIDIKTRQVIA